MANPSESITPARAKSTLVYESIRVALLRQAENDRKYWMGGKNGNPEYSIEEWSKQVNVIANSLYEYFSSQEPSNEMEVV